MFYWTDTEWQLYTDKKIIFVIQVSVAQKGRCIVNVVVWCVTNWKIKHIDVGSQGVANNNKRKMLPGTISYDLINHPNN